MTECSLDCDARCIGVPYNTSSNFCCVVDELLDMTLDAAVVTIPAVFMGLEDGERLATLDGASVKMYVRGTMAVDPSVFFIALLGIGTLIFASYRANRDERNEVANAWNTRVALRTSSVSTRGSGGPSKGDQGMEKVDLTSTQIAAFFVFSTCFLIVLFYLVLSSPHVAVIVLCVLFMVGSIGSCMYVFVDPVIRRVVGVDAFNASSCTVFSGDARRSPPFSWIPSSIKTYELLSFALATTFAALWFAFRHETWSFALQDVLAISIACVFLLTVRVGSLRTATLLLCLFFVYDVFMVFLSPFVFGGRSVMVEVATAGSAEAMESQTNRFACERRMQERMPMLFMIPRFDWTGGYSMLGLGDVFLPGLLVAFCLRVDYASLGNRLAIGSQETTTWTATHVGDSYWFWSICGYVVGLTITFVANSFEWTINGVRGQPALLYLVPFTLVPTAVRAHRRGELSSLWSGAALERASTEVRC